MSAHRVGECPELGQIAAAAEGSAVSAQHHLVDRWIQPSDFEGLQQGTPGICGERVVPLRPVEADVQRVPVTVSLHRVGQQRRGGRSSIGQPSGELSSGLQRRVGQRFGDHPGSGRPVRVERAQHVVTHRGGLRPRLAALSEFVQSPLNRVHGDRSPVSAGAFGQRERHSIGRGVDPDPDSRG